MRDKSTMRSRNRQKYMPPKSLLFHILLIPAVSLAGIKPTEAHIWEYEATFPSSTVNQSVQQVEIKGYVYNQDNVPLYGAIIREEGTNNSVLADKDGAYSIKVTPKEGLKLNFSFLGMKPQIIEVNNRRNI